MRVNIKGSKTDPFRQGCYVHIGAGHLPLCTLSALMTYLSLRGNSAALCSCFKMVDLSPGLPSLNGLDKLWPQPGFLAIFPATVFALGRPQLLLVMEFRTISFKPWAVGLATPISSISGLLWSRWLHFRRN